jgi:hypothetical protein
VVGHGWQEAEYGQIDEVHREPLLSIVSVFTKITPFIGLVM